MRQCQLGTLTRREQSRQGQSQAKAVTGKGSHRQRQSQLARGKKSILARLPEGEELSTLGRGQELDKLSEHEFIKVDGYTFQMARRQEKAVDVDLRN